MKNKRNLIILFIFIFVGATVAYYFNKTTFTNDLALGEFGTTATETFISPSNWKPGDTASKVVSITNNKSIPAAVRVSYEEKWYDENNQLMSNQPEGAVTININKPGKWKKKDNYYYYAHPILQNETVTFMDSVTFNAEVGDIQNCTIDGTTEICNSNVDTINGGTYKLIIKVETVQYDNYKAAWNTDVAIKYKGNPESFATDDWDTIVEAVQSGDEIPYQVGDTRIVEIDMDDDGTPEEYILRVANTSTPAECAEKNFSQTACGFVIEFADVIAKYNFYSTNTNLGGWKDSLARAYINTDIYNKLPSDLKDVIVDTTVISGHGTNFTENYITRDKLFLLSSVEVWGSPQFDTVTKENPALTRQLDYYNNLGVESNTNTIVARKKYNNQFSSWWLRSAISNSNFTFRLVGTSNGSPATSNASAIDGISPAFKIVRTESSDGTTPYSFATDDWSTIITAVRSGNTSEYNLGDTRIIEIDTDNDGVLENHILRIANNTTPQICETEGFSQTACGFVIEFADVLTIQKLYNVNKNIGGWRDCLVRTYVNDTIYNSLPTDLKDAVINTTVVSGYGNNGTDTENFITTDKLYLLSTVEVWGTPYYDTVTNENPSLTRQLDYYNNLGVTQSDNTSYAVKRRSSSNSTWWLRTPSSSNSNLFIYVSSSSGSHGTYGSVTNVGVSPAFRIG